MMSFGHTVVDWKEVWVFLMRTWIWIPSLSFKGCIILVKSLKRILFSHLQNGGGNNNIYFTGLL